MLPIRTLEDLLCIAADVVPGLCAAVMAPRPCCAPCAERPDLSAYAAAETGPETVAEAAAMASVYEHPPRCDGNRAAINALLDHWVTAYPEAGRAYWSLRCWGILIWQPIYLSVIAVHATQRVLSLDNFTQSIESGWTRTIGIADHAPLHAEDSRLITLAAQQIDACCAHIFRELSPVIRINCHAARCMHADCVLAALLAVRTRYAHLTDTQCEARGKDWLTALSLVGRGGFFAYTCTDGSNALALDRQTCCYHYRRHDGELCSTCPRLDKRERIVRLNATRDAARDTALSATQDATQRI